MSRRLGFARGTLASPSPDGELVFTASAEGTNRYGFSLDPKRWKLDNFNNNPVILWMHMDHMPPIGRAGVTKVDGSGLRLPVTFDRDDPFAMEIERKYRSGFLNAVSVGFDFVDKEGKPIDRWWNMDAEAMANAYYDLAEVSAVPVPADPQALIRQRHALAYDMGLNAPETDEESLRLLSLPPELLAALRGSQGRTEPKPPVLPGNSDVDRRLAAMEAKIDDLMTRLSGPTGEPKPPEPSEDEYSPDVVQDLLSAIKL